MVGCATATISLSLKHRNNPDDAGLSLGNMGVECLLLLSLIYAVIEALRWGRTLSYNDYKFHDTFQIDT